LAEKAARGVRGRRQVKSWVDFWNAGTAIYVNERHRVLHYRLVATDVAALITKPGAVVLDHGCGEALSADLVARRCTRLCLSDAAPAVRLGLKQRFAHQPGIAVLAPDAVEAQPDGTFDLIVANSLVQYLTLDELHGLLATWKAKLAPDGTLVVADVIPRSVGPLTDAAALISFAWKGGFLGAALAGLVRTALSDYRKLRGTLGLAQYDADEFAAILAQAGFTAARRPANIGHNQARMTFVARRSIA
jgi:SAM-dependent methyltransferase